MDSMHSHRTLAPTVSIIGLSEAAMGWIRGAIRTEARLPDQSTSYEAAFDDVVCRESVVALIGMDQNPSQALALSQELHRQHEGIRLIAITEQRNRQNVLEAMRAGFSEYLLLPDESEALRHALRRRPCSMKNPMLGCALAVVGTKGGCGVSTIAVHAAAELAGMHRVCAVDMDFGMGDIAAMLSLEPERSMLDLFSHLPGLNERTLMGSVSVHRSHLHVLPQPVFPIPPEKWAHSDVSSSQIQELLDRLQTAYQYVVLDCSGAHDLPTLVTLRRADQLWLVCTPDVLGVRNAWRRRLQSDQMGIQRARIRLIVNRWRTNAPLSVADIERNLGLTVTGKIRDDSAHLEPATSKGILLREYDSTAPAHLDISACVPLLNQATVSAQTTSPRVAID